MTETDRAYIPFELIQVGDSAELTAAVNEEDVAGFSRLFGDTCSFHISDESAQMMPFEKRIVHGVHLLMYVSLTIGQKLPGFGTLYCSQTLVFRKPVFIGETITARVQVLEKMKGRRLCMSTVIENAGGETVMDGTAVVKTFA